MIEQNNSANPLRGSQTEEPEKSNATAPKKPFVEPEISSPVDVLEATTFFIPVDSGTTQ